MYFSENPSDNDRFTAEETEKYARIVEAKTFKSLINGNLILALIFMISIQYVFFAGMLLK